jgi:TonB family protein
MKQEFYESKPFALRHAAVRLLQAAVFALVVVLAMPGSAADDRAVKTKVAPIYPDIARRMHITGTVNIEATVDPEGKVSNAKTVSGNALLAPAAEDAVRKWKFVPGPGTSKVDVEITFTPAQ